MTYTDMTDEEYDALDEELTRTIPKFGPNGTGWISQWELYQIGLTKLSTTYIMAQASAKSRSPAQIIDELVHEKIAAMA
jgi:hypothetical protein